LQTTLLGISVAIILALVAALVGPHFVDWTQHRAYFEAEATKLAGQPVRVGGAIDLRILPVPALTLGQVEIGPAAQPQARARELHVELALGSLMRGEIRASELRIAGPDVSLGVGANGKLDWRATKLGFDPDRLQIEKVEIEDGRVSLADGASGTQTALQGFWFKGDVRSLLGPAKGEGGFITTGERYSYRVGVSRLSDDGALRVRLGIDPADHPLAIEAEGALRIEESAPRFDGTLTLSRPAAVGRADGRGQVAVPWRASAKVKATPAQALFEQLEYQYGPDDRAIRLTGTAELRFGKNPRFESVLSARQIDLDRALALPEAPSRLPLAALKAFIEPLTTSYRPAFPVKLGVGIDAVTLATGTLQTVRGDLRLDGDEWEIETLEFRAPGFAQVRLGGRVTRTAEGVSFKGPAQIEASNPRAFVAWLEGRTEGAQAQSGTLRASGEFAIGTQQFSVERLKFEFDRKTIEGRLAYAGAIGGKPPRLDAELKAAELDVDGVFAFARAALDGTAFERPRAGSLSMDIRRATLAGIDVKGVSGTLKLDPEGLTFDKVRIADLADATFGLNGRMEGALDAPRGTVTFDVDARGLDGTVAVLDRYFPQAAGPLRRAAGKITPLKTQVTLGIEPASPTQPTSQSRIKLALDGNAGALRVKVNAEATGDIGALVLPDYQLDAHFTAADGTALMALTGLERVIAVDKRAGSLSVTLRGKSGADAQLDARLTAGGLAAGAKGTARLFSASGLAAALDLTLQAADVGPLRRGAAARATALLPVALRARLNATGNDIALEGITGAVGGTPVRGKLKLANFERIEGLIDTDAADVMALLAFAAGMPKPRGDALAWTGEPFGDNVFGDLAGRVDFTAARAALTPALIARQVRGALRLGNGEVAIDGVEGTLAGGRASAELVLRRGGEGLEARGKFALANADASAVLPSEGKPVVAGRIGLQAEFEGSGLSAASLLGSLKGTGMITLEHAQISGLDPKAFNAAIRAADQAGAVDATKIRDIVATVLDGGALAVPQLDAPFTVNAGQARLGPIAAQGQGADLIIAATTDLAEMSLDARLTLSGPAIAEGSATTRPEILVLLRGPAGAPKRTVDVSTLSGFLMLRSVERQARQIDAIEAERRDAERREAERKEAERKEAERREAAARSAPAPVPAALPAPQILEDPAPEPQRQTRPRPPAPQFRPPSAADRAPALPPPLHIGPAPGSAGKSTQAPRPAGEAAAKGAQPQAAPPPPPPPRSALDILFGVQR
jgi:large subunit ribosomal protein L24